MKNFATMAMTLCMLALLGCKKDKEEQLTDCIKDKIEAFKQLDWVVKIVKVENPNGTLFWFVNATVDGGEDVVNEDCEFVCLADCECDGSVVECTNELGFIQKIIWEK